MLVFHHVRFLVLIFHNVLEQQLSVSIKVPNICIWYRYLNCFADIQLFDTRFFVCFTTTNSEFDKITLLIATGSDKMSQESVYIILLPGHPQYILWSMSLNGQNW